MAVQNDHKLNHLERILPEGLLVDAAWLTAAGYSASLRAHYVAAGWLEQPAHRVYRRTRGKLGWQQVVISLQTLLGHRLVVGGRTALEMQGYAHYLTTTTSEIHLYGPARPPSWVATLPLKEQRFVYHNSKSLFEQDLPPAAFSAPYLITGKNNDDNNDADRERLRSINDSALLSVGLRVLPWGQWDWPLILSSPERAVLELLGEIPHQETFHQADVLMEGVSDLSPRRLQWLLSDCRSVKVKRLFFFFADRHKHAWRKRINEAEVDLGAGKRQIASEGRLDKTYQITVPRDLVIPEEV